MAVLLVLLLAAICPGASSRLTVKDSSGLNVQLDAWGNDAVRIRIGRAIIAVPSTQALLDEPPEGTGTPSSVTATSLTNGNLRVTTEQGLIKVERISDSKVLLVEKNHAVHDGAGATISFAANGPTEVLYGMGEHRHTATPANSNGSVRLPKPWTKWFQDSQNYGVSFGGDNTVPILHSSLGYSVLWNSPAFGSANFSDTTLAWEAVEAAQLDLWIAVTPASLPAGESALAPLLRGYVDVTGHAPKLPFWATGFWQCKNRYRNQSQVLEVARGYVKRGLPISVIVIDYMHWQHLGDWRLNKGNWVAGPDGDGTHGVCWPDPKAMVDELKEYGIEVMVSMWPLVLGPAAPHVPCVINTTNGAGGGGPEGVSCSINWKTLLEKQLLVGNGEAGEKYLPAPQEHTTSYVYDAFNPEARRFVWAQMRQGYQQYGIKTFWLDADEPESFLPVAAPGKRFFNEEGLGWKSDNQVGMGWVQKHHRMIHDGLIDEGVESGDFTMLSRGFWAGSQRYGTAMWSGDIWSKFSELAVQIKVAQGVALSGVDKWTTDIGGYKGGNPEDPTWRELIVRWFQFGAFCPLFRLHGDRGGAKPPANQCGGTDGTNEVWNFGEEAMAIIPGVMRLRETLREYVDIHMNISSATGMPLLRPMVLQFPNDPKCADVEVEDQYMFGPDWLVAPVYEQGAKNRSVYLPAGSKWEHYYSETITEGGVRITQETTLADFPLYRRWTGA